MKKCAGKGSELLGEIKRLVRSPMREEGLFGRLVRDKARKGPVLWHGPRMNEESSFHTGATDTDFLGPLFGRLRGKVEKLVDPHAPEGQNLLTRLYSRLGGYGVIDNANLRHGRYKNPSVVLDVDGSARESLAGKDIWDAAGMGRDRTNVEKSLASLYPSAGRLHVEPTTFAADKLREAKAITDINKTRTLAQVFPGGVPRSSDAAREALERAFGPHWIVKARKGMASADTNLTDRATGKELLRGLREAIAANGGASDAIGQTRSLAREVGPVRRFIDDMFSDTGISMNKKEYRVHVANGKVIPYATYGRGNVVDYANTILNPFRTREVRRVEDAVQKAVDKMKSRNDRIGASYGFDVGVDVKGKPFIVESNPSEGSIASSWFSSPFVADSTVAATRGRLPHWVKARNALYGGAAALGAGGVASGMGKEASSVTEEETAGMSPLARLILGGVSADSVVNAVKINSQANHMSELHNKGIKAFRAGGLGVADKARFLEGYADAAGGALNSRVAGLPAHWLLRATTPSADASVTDRLKGFIGRASSPSAAKEISDSRAHYAGFANNPRLAMLREIITDDPTATTPFKPFKSAPGQAIASAMADGSVSPQLSSLFGGGAYKDRDVKNLVDKRFSEFFLGGQNRIKGLNLAKAKSWGLTPYTRVMKPVAGVSGALGIAGLAAALMGGKKENSTA